jgi:hypothetical protein
MRWAAILLIPLAIAAPTDPPRRAAFDFTYQVLPLLHRQGCASAYCHGSATGRGGFKLSLFASDPAADHRAITEDLGGRRLDLRAPAHSLLLRKPTFDLEHGGGRRLEDGEPAHQELLAWIADGAPFRRGAATRLTGLELEIEANRLRAVATFRRSGSETAGGETASAETAGGETAGAKTAGTETAAAETAGGETERRDVTALCTFTSSDERVLAVDETGRVTPRGAGEAWLFARYASQSARLAWRRPYAPAPDATTVPAADGAAAAGTTPRAIHPLDRLWLTRLEELGLAPAAPAPADALARRLYLDLVDRLPTPAEAHAFAQHGIEPTLDTLLQTPAFAEKYGRHLARWFEIPLTAAARPDARAPLFADQHQRLVAAVARGETLHRIVERLLLEDRQLIDRQPDPRDRAELAGRAFLGIRIGCARCHNSPVDRWEQGEHLAFSALFANRRPDPEGGMQPGMLFDPETGEAVTPRLLPMAHVDASRVDVSSVDASRVDPSRVGPDHRRAVADFILRGGHLMLERNFANRVFASLLGTGLVEPENDHRLSNPARHESILQHLAEQARSGDLRQLVRHIVTARLYQTSSAGSGRPTDDAEAQFFARRTARPMSPQTYENAVATALRTPARTRLPRSPLARQLALLNSEFLHGAIRQSPVVRGIMLLAPDREAALRDLFRTLLCRPPTDAETRTFLPMLARDGGSEDLVFALMASREFGSIR